MTLDVNDLKEAMRRALADEPDPVRREGLLRGMQLAFGWLLEFSPRGPDAPAFQALRDAAERAANESPP